MPCSAVPPGPPATESAAAPSRPASLRELFLSFTRLALQGFGGVLPVAQRELVERSRWLSKQEFVELLSVAQVLPGPNIVNLSLMVGDRFFGVRGAFVALAGMMAAPLVIVLVAAAVYAELAHHPLLSGALRGMGSVAAGLILATGLKLVGTLRKAVLGRELAWLLAALTVLLIVVLHWPLLWVLGSLGPLGCALAWRKLKP
ncbi:chromate transporter [Aquabacterium sp. A7-Y]|uniref:chromate transporter n=1 Tax=Aquabacterium sp. A7-Y TaxID=1349605 RepID=UPI00223E11FB|nr:chromate transporter [Aquabacterium sp. A7-Y]MCW7539834.1 chromate transporter [Aquabacterium sp. A7-Y]